MITFFFFPLYLSSTLHVCLPPFMHTTLPSLQIYLPLPPFIFLPLPLRSPSSSSIYYYVYIPSLLHVYPPPFILPSSSLPSNSSPSSFYSHLHILPFPHIYSSSYSSFPSSMFTFLVLLPIMSTFLFLPSFLRLGSRSYSHHLLCPPSYSSFPSSV